MKSIHNIIPSSLLVLFFTGAAGFGFTQSTNANQGDSIAASKLNTSASAEEVVEVTVTGTGATPTAALDNAIRAALMQVAGTFMRADTKVENDQVVQDRIIAHNQGFIESAAKQGEPILRDGVYSQSVLVRVRRSKVLEILTEAGKADSKVDGESLYAIIKMKQEQKASATELLAVVFEGFPANILKCEVAKKPYQIKNSDMKLDDGQVLVEVIVDIEIDKEKWAIWCKGAKQAFTAIAEVKKMIQWNPKKGGATRVKKDSWFVNNFGYCFSDATAKAEHLEFVSQCEALLVSEAKKLATRTEVSEGGESLKGDTVSDTGLVPVFLLSTAGGSLEIFGISKEAMKSFGQYSVPPRISVDLVDNGGETLGSTVKFAAAQMPDGSGNLAGINSYTTDEVKPWNMGSAFLKASPLSLTEYWEGQESKLFRFICPYLWAGTGRGSGFPVLSSRFSLPFRFEMSTDDLLRCSSVKVELGARPNSKNFD